jgi:glycosyltransferase involved in cell wall biosynthesis
LDPLKRSTVLLLTTMNEIDGLRSIWGRIPVELFRRILVVDAASTDGTREFLADKKCEVFQQSSPGRGNAIREAMGRVTEDVVVLMASDGNDDPACVRALLAKIVEGYDVVSGSRFAEGGKTDDSDDPIGIRRLGNRFFTSIVNEIWKANYTDSTYGMRAFTREAWRRLNIDATGNETEFLMSIRCAKLGLRVCQIPVVEGRRAGGEVKARSLSTGLCFVRLILREL